MPVNGELRGRLQWSLAPRGTTVEDDATVDESIPQLVPSVAFRGGCEVKGPRDFITVGPIGSRHDTVTVTFRPQLQVTIGCLTTTLDVFEREVYLKPAGNPHREEYLALLEFLRALIPTRMQAASGVPESGLGWDDVNDAPIAAGG